MTGYGITWKNPPGGWKNDYNHDYLQRGGAQTRLYLFFHEVKQGLRDELLHLRDFLVRGRS